MSKTFKAGDFVFVKMIGFRHWPAKVMVEKKKSKYIVYFYGTNNYGLNVKEKDIFSFEENKERFSKTKGSALNFEEGMEEIKNAINGMEVGPSHINFDVKSVLVKNQTRIENSSPVPSTPSKPIMKDKNVVKAKLDSQFHKNPSSSTIQRTSSHTTSVSPSHLASSSKPKTTATARVNQNDLNNKSLDEIETENPFDEILQENFIEDSQVNVDNKISRTLSSFVEIQEKIPFLKMESKLIYVISEIKKSLNSTKSDTKKCVDLLMEVKEIAFNATDLMLKKYPNVIETILRLKRFVGIEPVECNQEFYDESEKIRNLAAEIYSIFLDRLNISGDDKASWIHFQLLISQFKEQISNYSPYFINNLCFPTELEELNPHKTVS